MIVGDLGAEIVLTDPLVRQTQVGITPVGVLTNVDMTRGIGYANVQGAGSRFVRISGPPSETAAGLGYRAVDVATGVEFVALVRAEGPSEPVNPGELVAAKIVRVRNGAVVLEREADGQTITEIVPPRRVYVPVRGGFVPAAELGRLRPGAEVFIPAEGGSRGRIIVSRPAGPRTQAATTARRTARR
jgi:hypothetical protein